MSVTLTPACRMAQLVALTDGLTLRLMYGAKELKAPGYTALKLSAADWKLDEPSGTATMRAQKFSFKGDGDDVTGWTLYRGDVPQVTSTRRPFQTEDGASLTVELSVDLLGRRG